MKSTAAKLFDLVINVVFYPVIVLILACVILFAFGVRPYITMSGSMEPEIQTGSVCFVNTKYDYDKIKVGDVVAYTHSSGVRVTHRVIEITDEGFETKGDSNDVSDGVSTTRRNYHGKTLFSIPYLGFAIKYLQRPIVLVIAFIIVLGIVAVNVIDICFSEEKDKGKEKAEAAAAADAQDQTNG